MDENGVAWQVLLIDTVGDILVDNVAVLTTQSGVVVSSVEESVKYDAMVNYIFINIKSNKNPTVVITNLHPNGSKWSQS